MKEGRDRRRQPRGLKFHPSKNFRLEEKRIKTLSFVDRASRPLRVWAGQDSFIYYERNSHEIPYHGIASVEGFGAGIRLHAAAHPKACCARWMKRRPSRLSGHGIDLGINYVDTAIAVSHGATANGCSARPSGRLSRQGAARHQAFHDSGCASEGDFDKYLDEQLLRCRRPTASTYTCSTC